jgi:hypothetical protein
MFIYNEEKTMPNHRPAPPAAHAAGPNGEAARATPLRWVPPGFKIETLGPGAQKALAEVVNPVYEQLVLQTSDSLERSTGLTHLYLLWEEMLHHFQVAESYSNDPGERSLRDYERNLSRYIELAKLKAATTNVLLRLRQMALKRQVQDNTPHLPGLPSRVQSFMDRCGNGQMRQDRQPTDQNAPGPGSHLEKSQSGAQIPSPERSPEVAKSQSVGQVASRDREANWKKRKGLTNRQFPLDDLLGQKPKSITEAIAEITARPQIVF